jgi:hypothetical protein
VELVASALLQLRRHIALKLGAGAALPPTRMLSHGLRVARSTFARGAPLLPSSAGGARRTLCSGAAALPWEPARFKGANIVIEKPVDDAFEPRLVLALDELREAGRRGVWMRVPIEHSAAAAVAARHGFAFHHAEGGTAAQAC